MFHAPRTALRVGTDALRVNPLRTALSTVGVIIGVAALVAVLSLADGMERTARQQFIATTGLQSIGVQSRTTESADGDIFPLADTLAIEPADAAAIAALPGVATSLVSVQARIEVRDETGRLRRMAVVRGASGTPGPRATLAAGRALGPADSTRRVAVLAHEVARRLDSTGDATALVGRRVVVRDE